MNDIFDDVDVEPCFTYIPSPRIVLIMEKVAPLQREHPCDIPGMIESIVYSTQQLHAFVVQ